MWSRFATVAASNPYAWSQTAYTADEIRLFIREAAKAGMKVAGHVQTPAGAKNAIDAGIWSIEHGSALNDDLHKQMAAKGTIWHDSSTWNSVSGWSEYGENVGMGPSNMTDPVGNLHTAFMNSSEHCQNILWSHTNPTFNQVGVGVVISNNTMYVTEIFVRRGSSSTSTTYHRSTTTRKTTTTARRTTTYRPVASVTHAAQAAAKPKPKPRPLAPPPVATPQTVALLVQMMGMDSDNVDPSTGAATAS